MSDDVVRVRFSSTDQYPDIDSISGHELSPREAIQLADRQAYELTSIVSRIDRNMDFHGVLGAQQLTLVTPADQAQIANILREDYLGTPQENWRGALRHTEAEVSLRTENLVGMGYNLFREDVTPDNMENLLSALHSAANEIEALRRDVSPDIRDMSDGEIRDLHTTMRNTLEQTINEGLER